ARLPADAVIARLAVEDVVAVAAGDVVAIVERAQREPVVGAVGERGKALDRIAGIAARVVPVGVGPAGAARERRAGDGEAGTPDEIVAAAGADRVGADSQAADLPERRVAAPGLLLGVIRGARVLPVGVLPGRV